MIGNILTYLKQIVLLRLRGRVMIGKILTYLRLRDCVVKTRISIYIKQV